MLNRNSKTALDACTRTVRRLPSRRKPNARREARSGQSCVSNGSTDFESLFATPSSALSQVILQHRERPESKRARTSRNGFHSIEPLSVSRSFALGAPIAQEDTRVDAGARASGTLRGPDRRCRDLGRISFFLWKNGDILIFRDRPGAVQGYRGSAKAQ